MDHITIFNEQGLEIGKKLKSEIDKQKDIFQALYVRVFIGEKVLLIRVVKKEGGIAKTNEGKWGLPAATIIRYEESTEQALERACMSDIGVVPQIKTTYPQKFMTFETSSPRIVFAYDVELGVLPPMTDKEFLLVDEDALPAMYEKGLLAETVLIFEK